MSPVEKKILGTLVALLLVVYIWAAFSRSLWTPDEPRVAGMAREMLDHGNWARPTLNGRAFTEKPPLYFWVAAFSIKIFGAQPWAPRLASVVFSLCAMFLTGLAGARVFGRRAGIISALVLGTSMLFLETSQRVMVDSAVGFACAGGLLCLLAAYDEESSRRRLWWCAGFWTACSVAFLAKSLPAVVAPGAAIIGLLLLERSPRKILRLQPWMLPLALAVIIGPWLWFAVEDGWLSEHLRVHILDRFTSKGSTGHRNPFYHYFEKFPVDFLPWTVLLVPTVLYLRRAWSGLEQGQRKAVRILACWAVGGVLAFSIPSTKRNVYLIPLFPAFALLVGFYIDATLTRAVSGRVDRFFLWLMTVVAGATALGAPVYAFFIGRHIFPALVLFPVGLLVSTLAVRALWAGDLRRYWAGAGAGLIIGCLAMVAIVLPEADAVKSLSPYARVIARATVPRNGQKILLVGYKPRENLLGLINFFLGRSVTRIVQFPNELAGLLAASDPVIIVTLAKCRRNKVEARVAELLDTVGVAWHQVVPIGTGKKGVVVANFVPAGLKLSVFSNLPPGQ